MAEAGQRLNDLLHDEAVQEWIPELVSVFFDIEARRALLESVRAAMGPKLPDLDEDSRASFLNGLLQELCREASRLAKPPQHEAAPACTLLSGPPLTNAIIVTYPAPVAMAYLTFTQQRSAAAQFGCLLDVLEALLHYLATVVVSTYCRTELAHPEVNRFLLGMLVKRTWSTGDLLSLLREMLRQVGDCEGQLPYPALPGLLLKGNGKPTATLQVLEALVELRNRSWGHGTGRTEASFQEILQANRQSLDDVLAPMPWLADWQLVRPVVIADGSLRRADLLNGGWTHPNQDFTLSLQMCDLPEQGGEVRADRETLLLVAPDRQRYLPLFPLALFRLGSVLPAMLPTFCNVRAGRVRLYAGASTGPGTLPIERERRSMSSSHAIWPLTRWNRSWSVYALRHLLMGWWKASPQRKQATQT